MDQGRTDDRQDDGVRADAEGVGARVDGGAAPRRPRRRVLLGAAAGAVLLAGGVTAAVVASRDGAPAPAAGTYPVRASDDGTSLVTADGDPFLYLADTVWLAPSRLDQEGWASLLDVRAEQGFTTVQVSLLPFRNLSDDLANFGGAEPLEGTDLGAPLEVGGRTDDPGSPDYDYWDHVDALLRLADERGLQVALVPAWYGYEGENWRGELDEGAAAAYGTFLGERLGGHRNLLWLLGGDNDPVDDVDKVDGDRADRVRDVRDATDAMAEAIAEAEAVPHLMSYHARRTVSSLEFFAGRDWHTFASAYGDALTWEAVAGSSGQGVPVVLTEAYYDGRERAPELGERRLRAQAWWAVLGGAGYAYGHEDVWDLDPGHGADSDASGRWQDALAAPSAADLTVLADAVAGSLPLRPADDVLVSDPGEGDGRVVAARSGDGRRAWLYLPEARPVEVALDAVGGRRVTLTWIDPDDGAADVVDTVDAEGTLDLEPPEDLDDAVLLVESA
ncbi:DUF4038 domain-containing protein [Cellulomonas endophytica]|uniref:apiosidase-like domain-containing protein n=1 Tax=Cellulomonas endophytica TaxID=2494735 RepID=UPI0013E98E59|nr:DUF4038 domain-containing protein [Cellulomonas endophytica]